jgi:hypothetical protein
MKTLLRHFFPRRVRYLPREAYFLLHVMAATPTRKKF